MKSVVPCLLACLSITFGTHLFAKDRDGEGKGRPAKEPQWNVRVEVLMVSMPQEKALALLPDLRDPGKIAGAHAQILGMVNRNEATLVGYPIVNTLDGQRAVSEEILEKRYPTEFEPPTNDAPVAGKSGKLETTDPLLPTAFETRNLGVTLEVEANVSAKGDWISVKVVPQRVTLIGFDEYGSVMTKTGNVVKVDQPQFSSTRTTTSQRLRNGHMCLLAMSKLPASENQIEFFIMQAFATPAR